MQKTNIEYLTHTWSPIAMSCTRISEGCKNCWHLTVADRLAKNPIIPEFRKKAYLGGKPILIEAELNAPLKVKKPAIIGVQFMGDLFHKDVKDKWIDAIWSRMAKCPQHTFLILTKRPERMAHFVSEVGVFNYDVLPNLWLGVTAENQKQADKRIPILLQIPAAVRFVSVEPMLEEITLPYYLNDYTTGACSILDWVIVGSESGPGARPMNPDWASSLVKQCEEAETPCFVKQIHIDGKLIRD